jgi:two-component system LytT family response regulator
MNAPILRSDDAIPAEPVRPPAVATLWSGGFLLLWALYALVFVLTVNIKPARAIIDAFANVLPVALLSIAVRAILKGEVMRRSTRRQVASHAVLAIVFAFTWYATVTGLLALVKGLRGEGFKPIGFSGAALTWQVFQGLIVYVAVAAVCYAVRGSREAASVTMVAQSTPPAPLIRYLIRKGDEITPVEVSDIVSITGAQDYSEVSTILGRHLVRLSLAEFEARLDPTTFIRVHRSSIINLKWLKKAESAGGGRLLAYMCTNEEVPVSRAGAHTLKRLIV